MSDPNAQYFRIIRQGDLSEIHKAAKAGDTEAGDLVIACEVAVSRVIGAELRGGHEYCLLCSHPVGCTPTARDVAFVATERLSPDLSGAKECHLVCVGCTEAYYPEGELERDARLERRVRSRHWREMEIKKAQEAAKRRALREQENQREWEQRALAQPAREARPRSLTRA